MLPTKWLLPAVPLIGLLLIATVSSAADRRSSTQERTFRKAKMYVEQQHKLKLRKVEFNFTESAVVVTGTTDKFADRVVSKNSNGCQVVS